MLVKSYEIYKKNLNSLNFFLIYGENIGLKQDIAKSVLELKEKKGEKYKVSVQVNMKIILTENNFFEKIIEKSATYDSIERKSEEKLIVNKLIEDLSNQIAQQIIFEILNKTK